MPPAVGPTRRWHLLVAFLSIFAGDQRRRRDGLPRTRTRMENRVANIPAPLRRDCPACGAPDARFHHVENGYSVVRCESCGLWYVNPAPDQDGLDRFYTDFVPPESADAWTLRQPIFDQIAQLAEQRIPVGSALDAGCGHGWLVRTLGARGWRARGIDLSPTAVAYGREQLGLDLVHGDFGQLAASIGTFDLLCAGNILEHVISPRDFLTTARSLLNPGGVFIASVPNLWVFAGLHLIGRVPGLAGVLNRVAVPPCFDPITNALSPPTHLSGFFPRTLEALLQRVGFESIGIRPAAAPRHVSPALGTAVRALYAVGAAAGALTASRLPLTPALIAVARAPA